MSHALAERHRQATCNTCGACRWQRQRGSEISCELTAFPCKICGNFLPLIFCQSLCVVGKCVHFHHRNNNNKLHKHNTKNIYMPYFTQEIWKRKRKREQSIKQIAQWNSFDVVYYPWIPPHEFRMCHWAEYWDVTAVARDIIDELLRHNTDTLCE